MKLKNQKIRCLKIIETKYKQKKNVTTHREIKKKKKMFYPQKNNPMLIIVEIYMKISNVTKN